MYCEKCKRIVETNICPACGSKKIREPETGDLCFLTEQDYVSSGILEDILKQEGVPFLKKEVLGAGLSFRVGPMLDRSRFYVPFEHMQKALPLLEDLFAVPAEDAEQLTE